MPIFISYKEHNKKQRRFSSKRIRTQKKFGKLCKHNLFYKSGHTYRWYEEEAVIESAECDFPLKFRHLYDSDYVSEITVTFDLKKFNIFTNIIEEVTDLKSKKMFFRIFLKENNISLKPNKYYRTTLIL